MSKRVLMIEDDVLRVRWVRDLLSPCIPNVLVTNVTNEKEFRRRFEEWATNPPDLVVIDQMIPYTTDEDESEDLEALKLNAFEGGTRCYDLLQADSRTKNIPTLFYTILDRERVPTSADYVKKTGDIEAPDLIAKIKDLLGLQTRL